MKIKIILLAFVFFGTIMVGCSSSTSINRGFIATPGVVITADDGTFVLKSGERFKTPFSSKRSILQIVQSKRSVVGAWKNALSKHEGKKVRVKVEGEQKELFGVLLFGSVTNIKNCTGPALRAHSIEVPKKYIDAAKGGRVSVVYETFVCNNGTQRNYNWMLWLSDLEFDPVEEKLVEEKLVEEKLVEEGKEPRKWLW